MKKKIRGCGVSKRLANQGGRNTAFKIANRRQRAAHKKICRRARLGEIDYVEPVISTGFYG